MENYIISDKLSDPMLYTGVSIEEILDEAMDKFYHSFLKKEVKPKYNSKDIFFDMNKKHKEINMLTLSHPERFLHISSLNMDETKYDMLFCENDSAKNNCFNSCENGSSRNSSIRLIGRTECIYRINRIHWIPEIIQFANNGSSQIQEWDYIDKDDNHKPICKRYIRYIGDGIDYVIILRDRKFDYIFVTAFPVLMKRTRKMFSRNYKNYINKKAE
jgi:hypothetical protein